MLNPADNRHRPGGEVRSKGKAETNDDGRAMRKQQKDNIGEANKRQHLQRDRDTPAASQNTQGDRGRYKGGATNDQRPEADVRTTSDEQTDPQEETRDEDSRQLSKQDNDEGKSNDERENEKTNDAAANDKYNDQKKSGKTNDEETRNEDVAEEERKASEKIPPFILEGRRDAQSRRTTSSETAKYSKLQPSVGEVMPSLDNSATNKKFI